MKIRQVDHDNSEDDNDESLQDDDNEGEEEEGPDSRFSSTAKTPCSVSGSPGKKKAGEINEDMELENKKFLELDKGLTPEDSESDQDGDSDDSGFKMPAKKPTKKAKKKPENLPMFVPMVLKDDLSKYEKIRQKNINKRVEMLKALMVDFSDFNTQSRQTSETDSGTCPGWHTDPETKTRCIISDRIICIQEKLNFINLFFEKSFFIQIFF